MFHHCNDPIRFGYFEHLELQRCCIVTWHLLAANSKLVENFEPNSEYSSFTKLWQSCSDPHPKISPIAIFAFYSLNYSLVARLQDNSRPKSPTKIETKRKLQQFTVSGWLIINGGESGSEQIKM